MKIVFLTVLIFLCVSLSAFAQDTQWIRIFWGKPFNEYGYSVQQTKDGGYIVAGSTHSYAWSNYDAYLIRTDSAGGILWTRTYGMLYSEEALSVQETKEGGYILAGYARVFGGGEVYTIKTDSLGEVLWDRSYRVRYDNKTDDNGAWEIQQTKDGGYILGGWTGCEDTGDYKVYLVKIDSLGDLLWSKAYGDAGLDMGSSVKQTADGGYIVVGWTDSFGAGGLDVYLVKTDSLGNPLWSRTYGGSENDKGYSVDQTTDGGYILAGWTESFGAGGKDVYLVKTDSLGNAVWSKTCGGSHLDMSYSVQETENGNFIATGWTESFGAGGLDVYLIKVHSQGNVLWSRTCGRGHWDYGLFVQQTIDGGFIVAGYSQLFSGNEYDVMLAKFDSLGNTCLGEFAGSLVYGVSTVVTSPPTNVDSPSTMVIDPPTEVTLPSSKRTTICVFPRGDVNGDKIFDFTDIIYLIDYVFKAGPAPDPPWTGDATCDDIIDYTDILYFIDYLFRGGPPPDC